MKVKVSRMSKVTAVLVAMVLVATLAFSVLAYFGNNMGGKDTPIIGSGSAGAMDTAGAASFDMANAEAIKSTWLVNNGATNDGSKVTWSGTRDSGNRTATDNGSSSKFPTKYFQLPYYGAFDFSGQLAAANSAAIGDRLFGLESVGTYNEIKSNSAMAVGSGWAPTDTVGKCDEGYVNKGAGTARANEEQKTGLYLKGSKRHVHKFMTYCTIALPDMVLSDGNVQMTVDFNAKAFGAQAHVGLGYTVIAETGDGGMTSPIFNNSSEKSSIGLNRDSNYNHGWASAPAWSTSTGNAYSSYTVKKTGGNNIDSFNNLWDDYKRWYSYGVNSGVIEIPSGTKYLRFIFALDSENGNYGVDQQGTEILISNLKMKFTDNGNGADGYNHFELTENSVSATNAYNGAYTVPANNKNGENAPTAWSDIRYFDVHYAVKNAAMKRDDAINKSTGIGFRYYNPKKNTVERIKLGAMKILGRDAITENDYLYIVEDKLEDKSTAHTDKDNVLFAHLDGTTDNFSGGVNMRIACRTGRFYVDNQTKMYPKDLVGKDTNLLVWDKQFGINEAQAQPDKLTQIRVDSTTIKPVSTSIKKYNQKESVAFDVKFGNLIVTKNEDLTKQYSPEKLYYYLSASAFKEDVASLVGNGAVEVTSFTSTGMQIPGQNHGKQFVTIFVCDAAGNATRLTGEDVYITADGSAINADTSIVNINKIDDTVWSKNNIEFTINAKPVKDLKDFVAGVRAYVKRTDLRTEGATPKYEVVELKTKDSPGLHGTFTISTNSYENIEIILVNIIDDDRVDVSTLPTSGTVPIKFDKKGGKALTYTARRDDSIPDYTGVSITNNVSATNSWTSGLTNFHIGINNFVNMHMFKDTSAKAKFQINVGQGWQDLTFDTETDITEVLLANGGSVDMYLGKPYGDNNLLPKGAIKMQDANGFKESYNGKVSFRIAFPNDLGTYYYFCSSDSTTITDENNEYTKTKIMLDNVAPAVTLSANYINADVKTLLGANTYDNVDYTNAIKNIAGATPFTGVDESTAIIANKVEIAGKYYVVRSVPRDDSWFWGTVAIKLDITNYNEILSKDAMNAESLARDLFRTPENVQIYDRVTSQNGVSYLTFCQGIKNTSGQTAQPAAIVESVERQLGFRVANGGGVVTEAKIAADGSTNVETGNDAVAITMHYDNIEPNFEIEIGGAVINDGRHWYGTVDIEKAATITDKTQYVNADQFVAPTFTADYWFGESTDSKPTDSQQLPADNHPLMYSGTVGTLTASTDGAYTYRITASNRAGRKLVKEVLVGLDRVADTVTITDWLATGHVGNVKYVRADNFAMNVTPSAKVSNVTYYFITSDRASGVLTDEEIIAQKASAKTATLDKNILTVNSISAMGDKYMYILAEDEAQNQSIIGNDGAYMLTIDTNKDYTLTLGGDLTKGGYTYTIYDKNDGKPVGAEGQTYAVPIDNLQVGYYVKVTANANAGMKFLGFYDDVQVDDPTNNIIDINIDYQSASRAYTKNGAFKTIISNLLINNNNQRGTSYKAIDGTFTEGTTGDNSVATAVSEGKLVISWLGQDPSKITITEFPATFDYTITVKNATEYWMEKSYAGTLIISDKAVLNIIFNSANAGKEYEYTGAPFLTYAPNAKVMGGDFATNFATYATAMDENNVNKASDFAKMLNANGLPDGAVITLENIDSTPTGVDSVINKGKYRWTITYDYKAATGKDQPETITNVNQYNIKFSYEFSVTPREISLAQKTPVISKTYDGTKDVIISGNKVINKNIVWDDFISATRTEGDALVGGTKLGDIIKLVSFAYTEKDVTASTAIMNIKVKDTLAAKNYKISTGTSLTFAATIETLGITIEYNEAGGQTFNKPYDGNDTIKDEDIDRLKSINSADSFWISKDTLGNEKLAFHFSRGAVHLAHGNVGGNSIVVEKDLTSLEAVGVNGVVNYHIEMIKPIENTPTNANIVKITRKTIEVNERGAAIKDNKFFDGTNFTIALTPGDLIAADTPTGIYGIPRIFESELVFLYSEKEGATPTRRWKVGNPTYENWDASTSQWIDSGTAFVWDAGYYTINIGAEGIGDDAKKVVVGNYILDSSNIAKDGYSYSIKGYQIKKQELHILVDGVDVNNKLYDGIGIGVDENGAPVSQTISDAGFGEKNTIIFKIVNQNGEEMIALPAGYTLSFHAVNNNADADTYKLQVNTILINGIESSTNYTAIVDNGDNIQYRIDKRTLKVSPKQDTMSFVAGATRMTANLAKYEDMNISVKGGDGTYSAASGKLLEMLSVENFNLLFTIMNGSEYATHANKALAASSSFVVPATYKWAVEGISNNYVFEIDTDAVAYIEQAKYYIVDLLYNRYEMYNDAADFQLPVFGLGHGYNVKTENGEEISLTGLSNIDYYKLPNATAINRLGEEYDEKGNFLRYNKSNGELLDNMALFGIGDYDIRFVKSAVADVNANGMTDYIIANVGGAENNEIYQTTIENKKIVVKNSATGDPIPYSVEVTPIVITIDAISLDNKNYGVYTVGEIARSYKYTTNNDNKGIADAAKRALVGDRDAENNAVTRGTNVTIKNYAGEYTPAAQSALIDAGTYSLDFSALQGALKANYEVKSTSRDVIVRPIEVFIKFTDAELTKVYDKEAVGNIIKNKFYTKWDDDVTTAVNNATGDTNQIKFKVGGGAEVNVGVYGLTIVEDEGTVKPSKNYELSVKVFMEGTPSKYTITKRPVNITMKRNGATQTNSATYGMDGFKMKGAFTYEIEAAGTNRGILGADSAINTALDNKMKAATYLFEPKVTTDDLVTIFDITFGNLTDMDATATNNYALKIGKIENFSLTKKVITPTVSWKGGTPSWINPDNPPVYGTVGVNVGVEAYEIKFAFSDAPTAYIELATLRNYLIFDNNPTEGMPAVDVSYGNPTEAGVITFRVNIKDNYKFVTAKATGDDITIGQAYVVKSAHDLDKNADDIKFDLKQKEATIDLALDKAYATKASVDAKNMGAAIEGYVYGDKTTGTAFDPFEKASTPYTLSMPEKLVTDELALDGKYIITYKPFEIAPADVASDTKAVYSKDLLVVTVKFAYTLENSIFYKINDNALTNVGDTKYYTKDFYVIKADAIISIAKKGGVTDLGNYDKNFFAKFEGVIKGVAEYDDWAKISIEPEHMKFFDKFDYEAVDKDGNLKFDRNIYKPEMYLQTKVGEPTKATAVITLDESKIDKNIYKRLATFYNIKVSPSDADNGTEGYQPYEFTKATVRFTQGSNVNMTYSDGAVRDTIVKDENGDPTGEIILASRGAQFLINSGDVLRDGDEWYLFTPFERYNPSTEKNDLVLNTPNDETNDLLLYRDNGKAGDEKEYYINTLNVKMDLDKVVAHDKAETNKSFMPNPKYFLMNSTEASKYYEDSPLYLFDMDFGIVIEKCSIKVELNYDKANGSPKHVFKYGATRQDIVDYINKMNVKITTPNRPNDPLDNSAFTILDIDTADIMNVAADEKDILDVGTYDNKKVTFKLKNTDIGNNYVLDVTTKGENVRLEIVPRRLYFNAIGTVNAGDNNVLFTSVFGKVFDKATQNSVLAKPSGITIEWYERNVDADGVVTYTKCTTNTKDNNTAGGSLTYADNDAKLKFARDEQNFYVGKHTVGITLPGNDNYVVSPVPELEISGEPKLFNNNEVIEKFYIEFTPLHIEIVGAETLDKIQRNYGTTYGTLKSAYVPSQLYDNIIFKFDDGNKGWADVDDDLVREEIRKHIAFKMTYADGSEFNPAGTPDNKKITDSTMLDAASYKGVYYTNYAKNIYESIIIDNEVANPSIVDITINRYDISDKVIAVVDGKNVNADAIGNDYNAKLHDGRLKFALDFNGNIFSDMKKLVYTVNAAQPTGEQMKNADTYTIVVSVSGAEVRDPYTGAITKEDASKNFEGSYTFTYTINKINMADVITNMDKEIYFDNAFHDDGLNIAIKDKIVDISQLDVTINGKSFMAKDTNSDKNGYRNRGIIKNVGAYAIALNIKDDSIKANFNDELYEFTFTISPKVVSLSVNDSEHDKEYNSNIRIALADTGIKEYYDKDTTNDIFLVDADKNYTSDATKNFTRKYTKVGDTSKTYTDADIMLAPVGQYIVTFTMTPGANYEIDKGEYSYQFEIKAKDISSYLEKYERKQGDTKDKHLNTNGVQLTEGAVFNKGTNKYGVQFALGGVTITFNSVGDIFKGVAVDAKDNTDYTANITGVELRPYLNGKLMSADIATFDVTADKAIKPTFKFANSGAYVIKVVYLTDGNVIVNENGKNFPVNVSMISIDNDKTMNDSITVKDVPVKDKENVDDPDEYLFTYDGATPTMILSMKIGGNSSDIGYDTEKITYKKDSGSGIWDILEKKPTSVGRYKAVFNIKDANVVGSKEVIFSINALKIDITFAEDNIKNIDYNEEFDIHYTTDENYIDVSYYADGKKLTAKPKNAGNYVLRATVKPEYLGDKANPNVVFNQEVQEHAFSIDPIKYTGKVTVSKYSGSKIYDGKMATIKIDTSLFSGLPEGATVKLKPMAIRDAKKDYRLKATVSSNNYLPFDVDYGTFEVKKAGVSIKLSEDEPKTTTTITVEPIKLDNITVKYSIDGENYQTENVFEGLEPNKEYNITVQLIDKKTKKPSKNYDFENVSLKVFTEREDKISMGQIVGMAAGGGVVVVSIIVCAVVMGIRRKRRV